VGLAEDGPAAATAARRSLSPGLLKSHYAPAVPLSLYAPAEMAVLAYVQSEVFLFFSPRSRDDWLNRLARRSCTVTPGPNIRVLSESGSVLEAAANLFDLLHELDRLGPSRIRAEMAPSEGLGLAVNDRLGRAANK
jgi:L-threonylcarbamoyladenylate synthase